MGDRRTTVAVVEPQSNRAGAIAILVGHVVILVVALVMLIAKLPVDLGPSRSQPTSNEPACALVPADDNLTVLALRPADTAARQAARWIECDPHSLDRVHDALKWDTLLIFTIGIGLATATVRGLRRSRWRRSGQFAAVFLVIYVACDVAENQLLRRAFDDLAALPNALADVHAAIAVWPSELRWVAALKFGAVLAALPMFFISLAIALGDVFGAGAAEESDQDAEPSASDAHDGDGEDPTSPTGPPPGGSSSEPARRLRVGALFHEPEDRRVPPILPPLPITTGERTVPVVPTMGVACSGGGIRSAAFNLGAFQALDATRPGADSPTEWQRVRTVSAVSGGSYLATAWISARAGEGPDRNARWSRGSREESHLRRHSSYIAPGAAGKLWATLRFLLGFLVNLAFVILAIAALAFPYGWLVGSAQESIPASGGGQIRFERDGAQIRLASGEVLIPAVDSTARLAAGQTAYLRPAVPVVAPLTRHENTTSKATTDADKTRALEASLAAAADGRTIPEGTQIILAVTQHPIEVKGRVYGCVANRASPSDTATCRADRAISVVLGNDASLVKAPRAVLTTNDDAVVQRRALLAACGAHPCERVAGRFHTAWAWMLLAAAVLFGMITIAARPRERLRAPHQRVFRVLTSVALVAVAALVVVPALVSWAEAQRWGIEDRSRLLGASTLTVILALMSQVVPLLGSGASPSTAGKVTGWFKGLAAKLRPWLVRLAAYVATPLILGAMFLFIASFASQREFGTGQIIWWMAALGFLGIIGAGADLNQWSLHPYYRDRIISAFGVDPTTLAERTPSTLDELEPNAVPKLVICAAANVSDERVTAPGRPVIPWQFETLAVGAPQLARVYDTSVAGVTVPAAAFTGKLAALQSLWTAVAVSGAAFSPAMGKMTRAERGLMALGNVRLGVWYPNPAMLARNPTWYQLHHPSPFNLAKEAFGLHKATDHWIYVTDGGHYENLGLVELLRRGEDEIYCFDASGDSVDTFGTIADAMRLAREELNIEIHFRPRGMRPNEHGISPLAAKAAWMARRMPDGTEVPFGWLIFAKLEVPQDAPFDIVDLARTLPKFPNHPTTDQLFTDQKFEAYRALGYYSGQQAAAIACAIRANLAAGQTIPDAVEHANPPIPADAPG